MATEPAAHTWSHSPAQSPVAADVWRRVPVTIAALAIYWLGSYLPNPAINPGYLPSSLTSLLKLGIEPALSAWLVAEVLKLSFPQLHAWMREHPRHTDRFNRYVVAGALLFAGMQAYSIAMGFEQVSLTGLSPTPVQEPGLEFRVSYTVIIVAGTALSIWLADQITRHGLGSGMWILVLSPCIGQLPSTLETIRQNVAINQIQVQHVLFLAVFALVSIGTLGCVEKARRRLALEGADVTGAAGPDAIRLNYAPVWPPLIALHMTSLVSAIFLAWRHASGAAGSEPHVFQSGTASSLTLIVGLIFALTYMQTAANFGGNGRDGGRADAIVARLTFVTALVYSIICVVFEVLRAHYRLPIMDGGWFIALVLVTLSILPQNLSAYFPGRPEIIEPADAAD